ncbi:MAG: endonuclease [Burkholderiales bacterium]|nr:endonuclease [Burkholderiales bacterium]
MRRRKSLIRSLLGSVIRVPRTTRYRSRRRRGPLYTLVAILSALGIYHVGYFDSFIDSVTDYFDVAKAQVTQVATGTSAKASSQAGAVSTKGNTTNDSFQQAKRTLEQKVVNDHRFTIYCNAPFDARKNITLPAGFVTPSHENRATKVEWEHVVPAENFGRFFKEWRDGDPQCIDNNGKRFKGRHCAEKVNMQYRYMQADMHNLFPAIGAVNALRSNYNFVQFPAGVQPMFGTCEMKIMDKKAEPPNSAKGPVARATLYMDWAYPIFNLSNQQKQLMQAWDKEYPPEPWECERELKIEKLQGNPNPFVKEACAGK